MFLVVTKCDIELELDNWEEEQLYSFKRYADLSIKANHIVYFSKPDKWTLMPLLIQLPEKGMLLAKVDNAKDILDLNEELIKDAQ